jgi:hypothetical protein
MRRSESETGEENAFSVDLLLLAQRIPNHEFSSLENHAICSATVISNHKPSCLDCDLCGEPLEASDRALAEHLAKHMNDYYRKPCRCYSCEISFGHRKDLD